LQLDVATNPSANAGDASTTSAAATMSFLTFNLAILARWLVWRIWRSLQYRSEYAIANVKSAPLDWLHQS
jgi:hypothetical protein